jgi:hypothetical protein
LSATLKSHGLAHKLRQFSALPARDRQDVLLAALWLPLIHARLRHFGLQSCLRSLGLDRAARQETLDAGQYAQASGCERSVAAAARHGLVAGTCLSRSLTLIKLMARRGMAGRLRIGVSLENGALEAHAWVEAGGVPLPLGKGARAFEPFQDWPGFVKEKASPASAPENTWPSRAER